MVGSWGNKLFFSVSDSKILTFDNFKRKISGEWATHSRAKDKDTSEFIRPGLQSVSFDMLFDATLGVRPRAMLDTLQRAVETGEYNLLVIGNRRVGDYWWKITDTSEAWENIFNRGELVTAKVTVTMEEYL